jgi:hypothetical protein
MQLLSRLEPPTASPFGILDNLEQFQTSDGLFKTFRIDYGPECVDDYINEAKAQLVETRYDHAFIAEILMRLRNYFLSEEYFHIEMKKSVQIIKNTAVIVNSGGKKFHQWRHYDVPHKDGTLILPDIDNVGRCLSALQRYCSCYRDGGARRIINNPDNFEQFLGVLWPTNGSFRPASREENAMHFAMMSYLGVKHDNDIDPVCNIAALIPVLVFLNRHNSPELFYLIEKVSGYLKAFLASEHSRGSFEYYEPPVLFYAYAKLFELCRKEIKRHVSAVAGFDSHEKLLLGIILDYIRRVGWKNSFEAALLTTSLMALDYKGKEVEYGMDFILRNRNPDGTWNGYRFYRQRHPHRIFGSKGLTTSVCLETLHYVHSFLT